MAEPSRSSSLGEIHNLLLRMARRLAAESDPRRVMGDLLDEAVQVLGADGGTVYRWEESRGKLVLVHSGFPTANADLVAELRPGEGALGLAAVRRAPVIINDYQHSDAAFLAWRAVGIQGSAAVPLLHEGRLLGSLCVDTLEPGKLFKDADTELLELLAEVASAVLVGVERARLEGVLLAVRTAEHELNNRLALTVGYCELLASDPDLPERLRQLVGRALDGAKVAAATLQRMQGVTRIDSHSWGDGVPPTLDLDFSGDDPGSGLPHPPGAW